MKFYECSHCHNIIAYVKSSGVPVMCCGHWLPRREPGQDPKCQYGVGQVGAAVVVDVAAEADCQRQRLDCREAVAVGDPDREGRCAQEFRYPGDRPVTA